MMNQTVNKHLVVLFDYCMIKRNELLFFTQYKLCYLQNNNGTPLILLFLSPHLLRNTLSERVECTTDV